ncbi:pilus assembly protein CpaC [Amycolatopsis sp. K13G38]|uniref:Pilus assembly protein CpaC n=1 Tax=Amycolatopsis acididurans TaxID=2724524 RepID=A0ABX1J5I2_9PSEU|nr:acyl-CoA dehydrogenase family protein [Amycolatopsis acididurans]NKQ55013.1 pilus assembly protein CpaC [Amycolatopsis acididurans]
MDFSVPDELKMFIDGVRQFREKELMPLEREFLLNGRFAPEQRSALEEKARQQGFWALDVPEEYGGQGMGHLAMCMVVEELYKHPAMFEFGGSPEPILYHCNEEQKERYLYPIIKEGKRTCYAFTEPSGGSDLAAIRTTATRDGNYWIINGTKTFISHVERADFVILFATVDHKLGSKGITCFLIDRETRGLHASRPIPTMGDDWEPYELVLDSCVVPDANRLGKVGNGWVLAGEQLTHGRLRIAAYQLGIAQRCIDIAVDWAKQRHTWGQPIATRQGIQWMLADSITELTAARALVYRAAWIADTGFRQQNDVFAAKLYASEMAQRVTDRALQILGGLGYSRELAIQSFYRQARLWRIGHGTAEIHRMMIARNLLGLSANS